MTPRLWDYVLCLGDSLTFGARDEYGRGYPPELADLLSAQTRRVWICQNEGVNAETSSDVLRRATRLISARSEINVVTLLAGTNDTKIPMPVEVYRSNLRQIVDIAQVFGRHVVLGTLPELNSNPWYDQTHVGYVANYNEVIREIAASCSCRIADFSGMGDLLVDGVHFGHAGYREMARRWAEQILHL